MNDHLGNFMTYNEHKRKYSTEDGAIKQRSKVPSIQENERQVYGSLSYAVTDNNTIDHMRSMST